jgi:ABC-2 type transport system ATP-binding protein
MAEALLVIENLTKRFGPLTAVDGISFSVHRGEVLGFLGPNGAGKSTTMKMITGFLAPTAGGVTVCGHDVTRDAREAQRAIGYLPEGAPAYPDMTPRHFLRFIAEVRGLHGVEADRAIDQAIERTTLDDVLEQPIETLSKGFKRRVGLAQAILHDPPVLVMDEPTDGLDPNQKHAVRALIIEMAATKAILISTHILEEVEAVCSRALIIDRGHIVADGTPEALLARSRHHGAVTVHVPREAATRAAAAFRALDGADGVTERDLADGLTAVTLFPRAGTAPMIDLAHAALGGAGIEARAFYVEPGRLDEVFRALTTSDTRTPHKPAEAVQ